LRIGRKKADPDWLEGNIDAVIANQGNKKADSAAVFRYMKIRANYLAEVRLSWRVGLMTRGLSLHHLRLLAFDLIYGRDLDLRLSIVQFKASESSITGSSPADVPIRSSVSKPEMAKNRRMSKPNIFDLPAIHKNILHCSIYQSKFPSISIISGKFGFRY
jgi:hypothetical protein